MKDIEFRQRLSDKIYSLTQVKIDLNDSHALLFSSGLIDSMTIVEIIVLIEDCWKIQVDPSDLSMDNFDSMAAIMAYVQRKLRSEI